MANKKQRVTSFNYRSVESQLGKIADFIGVDINEWGGMGQVIEYCILQAFQNLQTQSTDVYIHCQKDAPGAFEVYFPDHSGETDGWDSYLRMATLGDVAKQLLEHPHYSLFVEVKDDKTVVDCYSQITDDSDPAGIRRRMRGTDKIGYTQAAITFVPKIELY